VAVVSLLCFLHNFFYRPVFLFWCLSGTLGFPFGLRGIVSCTAIDMRRSLRSWPGSVAISAKPGSPRPGKAL